MNILKSKLESNKEYLKLKNIGGHKKYHLEGDAFTHSMKVYDAVVAMGYEENHLLANVALLHDVGKIYTSIQHGPDDWEYPDHAACGAFRGILSKFVPEDHPDFKAYQWYIRNHIKPLFWQKTGIIYDNPVNYHCRPEWLRDLALADIAGSISMEPQTELIRYLKGLEF